MLSRHRSQFMSFDKTERKRLEYSALQLAAIVDSSDDAIISKDMNGIIQSWNRGAERIFGYTEQEAVGRPVQMLIPVGRENEEPSILARITRGERVVHYETTRRRKDGSLIEISLTESPIKDDEGKVIGASKIARDIGDRNRMELLQRRLSAIVESSDDAIISKDLNGIIQSWNGGAERMFGYTAAEAVGQPVTMLMPRDRIDEEPGILERVRRGDQIDHYQTVRRRKDGGLINVSLGVSPIRDSNGMVIGASKIARNVTDQERTRIELETTRTQLAGANADLEKRVAERTAALNEAMTQMQEFSYTISHDLRSPVRSMQGYAAAILELYGAQLDTHGKELLQRIVRSGVRMDKLIRDVLIYSRLSLSNIQKQKIDLKKLLNDTLLRYEEFQGDRIDVVVRQPLSLVCADETLLIQVLANVFGNALKFVPTGTKPRVEVWTEEKAGKTRVWMKDNGIGIRPEFQPRIFGMFERAHQDPRVEGTGIGLAIARRVLGRMEGEIGVESDGEHGSAFWIELPCEPEPVMV
jgi:PAS domain S-box-containing protein